MKYAVVEIAGKQLKLSEGESFYLDKNNLILGSESVVFDKVLLLRTDSDTQIGTPYVAGIKVSCQVLDKFKREKVVTEIFKAKSRYHKKIGLKRVLQELLVKSIGTGKEETKSLEVEKKPKVKVVKKAEK